MTSDASSGIGEAAEIRHGVMQLGFVCVALVIGFLVVSSAIGAAEEAGWGSTPRPAEAVVRSMGHDGFAWRLVTVDSDDGRCLNVVAAIDSLAPELGSVGGCGLPSSVGFDGDAFRQTANRIVGGHGVLSLNGEQYEIGFGVLPLGSTPRVQFADGETVRADGRGGSFLVVRRASLGRIVRVDALRENGSVIDSFTPQVVAGLE